MALGVNPGSVANLVTDTVGAAHVQITRDLEFSAWSDIAYKAVATPTTAEVCKTSTACRGLYIVANPANTNPIAIGPNSATNATTFRGIPVYPGVAHPVPVNNTNLVYVDNKAGDTWAVVYFTHTDS